MTSTELENAEKRMQQKWYDLIVAEREGASTQALERKYSAYILAAEEYNRRCLVVEESESAASVGVSGESVQLSDFQTRPAEQQERPLPVAHKRRTVASPSPDASDERKKRAS